MQEALLHIADYFFLIFHTALTLFNVFGWIFKKTLKLNLITLLLTGGSWFILGIFYGMGYCPLTDWHFDILRKLGADNLPASYLKYLIERLTNYSADPELVNTLTVVFFFVALAISAVMNVRNYRKK
ncbi:MAG: DUF2784 family protein [Bacteroidota bacterium]